MLVCLHRLHDNTLHSTQVTTTRARPIILLVAATLDPSTHWIPTLGLLHMIFFLGTRIYISCSFFASTCGPRFVTGVLSLLIIGICWPYCIGIFTIIAASFLRCGTYLFYARFTGLVFGGRRWRRRLGQDFLDGLLHSIRNDCLQLLVRYISWLRSKACKLTLQQCPVRVGCIRSRFIGTAIHANKLWEKTAALV